MKRYILFLSVLQVMATTMAFGAASCPAGYIAVEMDRSVISLADTCPSDFTDITIVNDCTSGTTSGVCYAFEALCGHGITKLRTGNGGTFNIYASVPQTKPYMVFKIKTGRTYGRCYGKLTSDSDANSGAISIRGDDGTIYHMTN